VITAASQNMASSTASWLSAGGTLFLGALGAVFTAAHWWGNGFQPTCSAEVEANGDAIRVRIKNRGRGAGVISRVVIVHENLVEVDWAKGKEFRPAPTRLPGLDQIELIINAPHGSKFLGSHRVLIEWAKKREVKELQPVGVGLYGLESLIPPQ